MTDRLDAYGSSLNRIEAGLADAHFRLEDMVLAMNAFQASFTVLCNQQHTIIEQLKVLNNALNAEPEESQLPELIEAIYAFLLKLREDVLKLPKETAALVNAP